jgi:hypothetical protein
MRGSLLRGASFVVLSAVALFAVVMFRCVLEARAEHAQAQAAVAQQKLDVAVTHFHAAARWNAPFNLYAQDALQRLEELAHAAELRQDNMLALRAYRGVHGALHATRGTQVSNPAQLDRVDARIAALMAQERPPEIDSDKPREQRERELRAQLHVQGPNTLGVLLSCGGFFTWVIAFGVLILRGLDGEGRIVRHVARPSFLCVMFGWVAFAVGLQIA